VKFPGREIVRGFREWDDSTLPTEGRMIEDIHEAFEECEDEFGKFERVENPLHPRPDICAFMMLHAMLGGSGDMVCGAEHDEIYLDVDAEKFAAVATKEQVRDLRRCGVMWSSDSDSLSMFV
jgi:hypothetical protein